MSFEPSSHASPSPAPSPSWAPPRAPLPPHRLAKIANALGVAMPSPAMSSSQSFPAFASSSPVSASPSTFADNQWRSPTPSATSNAHFSTYPSTPQSKFLLHIIPPRHLARVLIEGSDDEDGSLGSSRAQFRRGALVPFQSTLQAQLVLIAKEYSLPSTFGIMLYLVSSKPTRVQPSFLKPPDGDGENAEPGPRLSEDVWRYMWARAMKAEQEDSLSNVTSPLSSSPSHGVPVTALNALRPLVTPFRPETPQTFGPMLAVTPSPSTTGSSVSDIRSHSKSAPPSSSSPAQSEPETPDTSEHDGQGLDLPGLHSDAFVPVLAKVEFDIDRHKAKWYNQWRRNRRMTASRTPSRQQTGENASGDERKAPFNLKLVGKHQNDSIPSFLREEVDDAQGDEYARLSDSPTFEEESMTRGTILSGSGDPLADVFGSDASAWQDMHADAPARRRRKNPKVVPLALDASALEAVEDESGYSGSEVDELAEVRAIIQRLSQVSDDLMSHYSPHKSDTFSTRRTAPPPLVIAPKSPNGNIALGESPMPSNSDESARLAYTVDVGTPMNSEMRDKGSFSDLGRPRSRSSQDDKEKRDGVIYDDLDLGLDFDENDLEAHYDENDPNDRRRSQYAMKARLDEIERAMAQFSPKKRRTDRLGDDLPRARSPIPSPLRNANVPLSAPPVRMDSLRDQQSARPASSQDKAWGASVTHSPGPSLTLLPHPPSKSPKMSPSPRLGLNGVPRPSLPPSRSSPSLPSDSEAWKKDANMDNLLPLPPSLTRKTSSVASPPIIPLSPDPFGRNPSFQEQAEAIHWDPTTGRLSQRPSISSIDDAATIGSSTANSSRFSADSSVCADDTPPNTAKEHRSSGSIVTMKGFKKLWRKSRTQSISVQQPPPVPAFKRDSLQPPAPPPISRSSSDQSRSSSRSTNHTPPPVPSPFMGGFQSYDLLYGEQEGATPMRATAGRKFTGSGHSSPANALDMVGPLPELPDKTGSGGRKSILKWKGPLSHQSTGSESRPVSTETVKPGRPSVMGNTFVPPSPQLSAEYYAGAGVPNGHARSASGFPERRSSIQPPKMSLNANSDHVQRPSQSSQISLSSLPRSPPGSILSSRSQDSEGSRGIDAKQFEMVSRPVIR